MSSKIEILFKDGTTRTIINANYDEIEAHVLQVSELAEDAQDGMRLWIFPWSAIRTVVIE